MRQGGLRILCGRCLVASFVFLAAGAVLYLSRPATLATRGAEWAAQGKKVKAR